MKSLVSASSSLRIMFAALGTLLSSVLLSLSASASDTFLVDADRPDGLIDEPNIRDSVVRVINYILSFLGLIAVIMVIYAGFLMIFSAGNDDQVGTAKNVIIWVAIGIIVILLSYAIVNFVLDLADAP